MSLFDQLVDEALKNQKELSPLRMVVEKELLHHDILGILSETGLLAGLTFMGGTCLRACYGSSRLSEDLDFTGGAKFNREMLSRMSELLIEKLMTKYGLRVDVSEPVREEGNVDTWKIRVQTRPNQKDMPAQRINIDVCSIPSYQAKPMVLLNPYSVEMGTGGLLLQVESREEIFADKLLAFALRPNRLKARDLWDIAWLTQQGIAPAWELLELKLKDHQCVSSEYLELFSKRTESLRSDPSVEREFKKEMQRFLPPNIVSQTINNDDYWEYLIGLLIDLKMKNIRQLAVKEF
jgi:predicted nucleotidyltransferase component of viral defense system